MPLTRRLRERRVAVTPLGELYLLIAGWRPGRGTRSFGQGDRESAGRAADRGGEVGQLLIRERAPAAVVEEHRKRKADFTARLAQLTRARDSA